MPYTYLDPATAAAAPASTVGAPLSNMDETLLSMRTWLLAELAGRTDVAIASLNSWINDAYKYITNMVKPLELDGNVQLNLVASQPLYNLPSNIAYTRDLTLSDTTDFYNGGTPLNKIDLATYRRLMTTATNVIVPPRSWFRFGRIAVIWPTPRTAYTAVVDFRANVQSLTLDTDSPILQSMFNESIRLRAKRNALRALKLYQEASMAQNDFLEAIRPLINTDAEENAEAEFGFQPARGTGDLYEDQG